MQTESREYLTTHAWITFQADLRRLDSRVWMLLGEAQSKCHHIRNVPLKPGLAERLHQVYLAKGALATTAIEGNTLNEQEALARIEGVLDLSPSMEYLGREIDNIVAACNRIGQLVFTNGPTDPTVELLKDYNRSVLQGLTVAEDVVPGQIRRHSAVVGPYRGAPAEDCAYLLERLCDWLPQIKSPDESNAIAFGIVRAILAHLYMAWIHPFGDGNGRTARLLEFHILLSHGVPSTAAHLLSNHYNQTRSEYYRQLDLASKSGGDIAHFLHYALQGFVDQLAAQIQDIQDQQLTVHLENYIHDVFRNRSGPANSRRRMLALDLMSLLNRQIPTSQMRHISPRVAEAYAGKTDKTVKRDLNALTADGLLIRDKDGYRLHHEIIFGFLPGVAGE